MPIAPSLATGLGLSANTKQHAYQGPDHFLSIVNEESDRVGQETSEYIIFTDVTPDIHQRDFVNIKDRSFEYESYFPDLNIILIKMESESHAVLHGSFNAVFTTKLALMGSLFEKLHYLETRRIKTEKRGKKADKSYRPIRLPSYRGRMWPTVAVEVGISETPVKLKRDAIWWLEESNGDVKVVVTISTARPRKWMVFETWALVGGAPQMTYQCVMSQEGGKQTVQASNHNPLVIHFEDLFLRAPEGPVEDDIYIDTSDLEKIATRVWETYET